VLKLAGLNSLNWFQNMFDSKIAFSARFAIFFVSISIYGIIAFESIFKKDVAGAPGNAIRFCRKVIAGCYLSLIDKD
jgi:hypothetical protein